MKIKSNLMFSLIIALIGVVMGWVFNESYTNSMIGAGIFAAFSFVIMCADDKWGMQLEPTPEPVPADVSVTEYE